LREQLQALRNSESLAQEAQRQAAIAAEAEQRRAAWLNQNEQAQQNFSALDGLHRQAVNSGLVDTSPAYFEFLNSQLESLQARQHRPADVVQEMRSRVAQEPVQAIPPPSRGPLVSAPVSRDAIGSNSPSRIRLSREQCEMARAAGITEAEYAKELQRLNEMKRDGHYQERR
jgi:hypothetical protein